MSWRSPGDLEGPWPRHSYLCAACKTCAAGGKSWRRQWTGNQCGWWNCQDRWTLVPWENSSSPTFTPSSPVSQRQQGVESHPWGMGCLRFAAPVYSGCYCLLVLRGLVAQHWNLLGLLQYCVMSSDVVALPRPGFASWGVRRPLSGSALASREQSVATHLPKRCWWLPLIEWVPCNSFVEEALAVAYDTTRWSPQMALTDDARKSISELHDQHVLTMTPAQHKKRELNREHQCGAGQIPSKGQVRTSQNSRVLERSKLCVPWLVRVLGLL